MIVTFCGHSQIYGSAAIVSALKTVIEELISEGATEFYLGGYGDFDSMAASAVHAAKTSFPNIHAMLIIPFIDRSYDMSLYDGALYPPLERVPRRFAIRKRNEWMVAQADVIISYVTHNWGGAAATLRFAERKRKRIISVLPGQGHLFLDRSIISRKNSR